MLAPKATPRHIGLRPLPRAMIYGLAGCSGELFFTACASVARVHRFHPHTSPMMLPIYVLIQPLFEPVHILPPFSRRSGAPSLRRLMGRAPWDYSSARWQLDGLIRFDYFPLWAVAGLLTERLHDLLTAQPRVKRRRPERP